ncbi:hypothetical protein KQX54_009948 [Cotesia glomerata]|uniref:Uncharacterized protein n=1 Tax=Cotesia glomerata TaxID=32391 RepID=A0AAV7J436_COTGL|nr:hypothetical protein KQX54_009948 [Cotesia glomerata]
MRSKGRKWSWFSVPLGLGVLGARDKAQDLIIRQKARKVTAKSACPSPGASIFCPSWSEQDIAEGMTEGQREASALRLVHPTLASGGSSGPTYDFIRVSHGF